MNADSNAASSERFRRRISSTICAPLYAASIRASPVMSAWKASTASFCITSSVSPGRNPPATRPSTPRAAKFAGQPHHDLGGKASAPVLPAADGRVGHEQPFRDVVLGHPRCVMLNPGPSVTNHPLDPTRRASDVLATVAGMHRRQGTAALLTLAAAITLSACSAVGPSETLPSTTAPTSSSPTPLVATPTPTAQTPTAALPAAAPARPSEDTISCETMLRPAVLERIRSEGLIAVPKTDYNFGVVTEGPHLSCPWGTEGILDATYLYSWTTLTERERADMLAAAIANGYYTEQADIGTWLTRDDYNGYPEPGFLVGDDYVVVAPSRAEVTDIVWVN